MREVQFQLEEIISYTEMTAFEKMSLQHGMNFREDDSVFLMSRRPGAPYADMFDQERDMLIYEGHDEPRRAGGASPKLIDQPLSSSSRNLKFFRAAAEYRNKARSRALLVRVYEKIKRGIWVYNGTFALEDAWVEDNGGRNVIKFGLTLLANNALAERDEPERVLVRNRIIPSSVKQEVFKRDAGKCVLCGSNKNLHYDHDLAYSRGGTSLLAANIRLLCASHNLQKGARIE